MFAKGDTGFTSLALAQAEYNNVNPLEVSLVSEYC
jgi:hypothetical protein